MNDRVREYLEQVVKEQKTAIELEYALLLQKDSCVPATKSPIESLLYIALYREFQHNYANHLIMNYWIHPQFPLTHNALGKFGDISRNITVDFHIGIGDKESAYINNTKVIVECDGHEFHEKTPEQVEKDKVRERIIQSYGFHVLRFSGREIWKNPTKCAEEVLDFLVSERTRRTEAMRWQAQLPRVETSKTLANRDSQIILAG